MENETTASASVGAIWAAISGFENYRRWHPFVRIEGIAGPGEVVGYSFRSRSEKAKRWSVEARVAAFEFERRLTVSVGFPYLGMEETYSILPMPTGVRIVHGFRFTGILALLGLPAVKRNLVKMLAVEDHCLVQYVTARRGRKIARHGAR